MILKEWFFHQIIIERKNMIKKIMSHFIFGVGLITGIFFVFKNLEAKDMPTIDKPKMPVDIFLNLFRDKDGDGYTPFKGDCDDTDSDINPGAEEVCDDKIDNNCNGKIDESDCSGTDTGDAGGVDVAGGGGGDGGEDVAGGVASGAAAGGNSGE